MRRRIVHLVVLLTTVMALAATPVFAEGYNKGNLIEPGTGWGPLTGDSRLEFTPYAASQPGPHGGYTTTTNRCQDCHSTHYAYGSYKLLRASSREAACDFCHTGGGGSNVNIMMDNAYTNSATEISQTGTAAVDATTTMGFGTGHTLGYKGHAPTDIRPAYSDSSGFSCFDCHTPHGNSERVLTTFLSPGTVVVPAYLEYTVHLRVNMDNGEIDPTEVFIQPHDPEMKFENIPLIPTDWVDDGEQLWDPTRGWHMAYGIASGAEGNIEVKYDFSYMGLGTGEVLSRKPIFPTGRYLLLKNPDNENGLGLAGDLTTSTVTIDGKPVHTSVDTSHTGNKIAIDWLNPLGPAMTIPPDNDYEMDPSLRSPELRYTGNDERFPYPWFVTGQYDDLRPGIATVGEFCTDCHDGAAGQATQAAEVWKPDASDSSTGTYQIAYSHDSQPRSCDRKLILNSDDTNNFGPECRGCHVGASSCSQCHADPGLYSVDTPLESVWDTEGHAPMEEGYSVYQAQPSNKAVSNRIYSDVDPACVDGGFSFPHRTLGVNMLKDSLWGVDFDGTPLAAGEVRGAGLVATDLDTLFGSARWGFDLASLVNVPTDSLDSVCLDCHNPNIWNADDSSYSTSFTADNQFNLAGYRTDGAAESWTIQGWDVLLKGLP